MLPRWWCCFFPSERFALSDDFAAPLSSDWSTPRTEEPGSFVTAPVADEDAADGQVLEQVFPGATSPDDSGPAYATELETAAPLGYGTYQARLRAPKASRATGLVSAFFTYFNDGADHDMDGVVDNQEIDVELLAAEPSTIYMTVWTEYQYVGGIETFHKTTRKVDLRTGRVWETPPALPHRSCSISGTTRRAGTRASRAACRSTMWGFTSTASP